MKVVKRHHMKDRYLRDPWKIIAVKSYIPEECDIKQKICLKLVVPHLACFLKQRKSLKISHLGAGGGIGGSQEPGGGHLIIGIIKLYWFWALPGGAIWGILRAPTSLRRPALTLSQAILSDLITPSPPVQMQQLIFIPFSRAAWKR